MWTIDGLQYTKRKAITIQHANVDANLTDFPVLVKITNDAQIGAVSNADGFDIRFTASDGSTLLKFERESFAISGGNANGIFWVKVPSISAVSGATIYIYYRDTDTADGQDVANVWDDYAIVMHMENGAFGDSSGNGNNGSGSLTQTTGMINEGAIFGGADQIVVSYDASFIDLTEITIEAWARYDGGADDTAPIAGIADNGAWKFGSAFRGEEGMEIMVDFHETFGDGYGFITLGETPEGVWRHMALALKNDDYGNLYINGVIQSAEIFGALATPENDFVIGLTDGASGFYGVMDELRVSQVQRSEAWMKFDYYNVNESDKEQTWGSEETSSGTTTETISKTLAYRIIQEKSATKALAYLIKTTPSAITKAVNYAVKTAGLAQKAITYAVKSTPSAIQKAVGYFVKTEQTIEKDADYYIKTSGEIQKGSDYRIKKSQSSTKASQYRIKKEGSVTKAMAYEVATTIERVVTKTLRYTIKKEKTLTKGLQYIVRIYPYSKKDSPYGKFKKVV